MSKKLSNQFSCSRLMLPAHRKKLNECHKIKEEEEKYCMPNLDDQQKEQFQFLISQSLQQGLVIEVTLLTGKSYSRLKGEVKKIDPLQGKLNIVLTSNKEIKMINLKEIIEVKEGP